MPLDAAFFNLIEFAFHIRREFQIHNRREIFDHKVADRFPEGRGDDCLSVLFGVRAFCDDGDYRGVRRRTSDAVFFHSFDKRRVGVTLGRLGEFLLVLGVLQIHHVAFLHIGQRLFGRVVVIVVLVFQRHVVVNLREAVENKRASRHLVAEFRAVKHGIVVGGDMDVERVVHRVDHLACQKSFVYEFVQSVLIAVDFVLQTFGRAIERYGTDCLVRVLRVRFRLIKIRFFGRVFFAVMGFDVIYCVCLHFGRNTHAVGTNVRYESGCAFPCDFDAFVKLLRDLHRLRRGERQFCGSVLLQCGRRKRGCRAVFRDGSFCAVNGEFCAFRGVNYLFGVVLVMNFPLFAVYIDESAFEHVFFGLRILLL